MTDLAAENARLRAQLGDLDRVLDAIEGVGAYAVITLEALVASFEGDPAHERVCTAIIGLSNRFSAVFCDMGAALRSTNH